MGVKSQIYQPAKLLKVHQNVPFVSRKEKMKGQFKAEASPPADSDATWSAPE